MKKLKTHQPSLNLLERRFYVLYSVKEGNQLTWYKINKNSLKKRLHIQDKELNKVIDAKTGKTSHEFAGLIEKKHALLESCKIVLDVPFGPSESDGVMYSGDPDQYKQVLLVSERLVESCVDNQIPFPYKKVLFLTLDPGLFHFAESPYKGNEYSPNILKNYKKDEILVALYNRSGYKGINRNDDYSPARNEHEEYRKLFESDNSPLKVVNIDKKSQEQLIKKGELSKKLAAQLH